jgi:hypothetical protein
MAKQQSGQTFIDEAILYRTLDCPVCGKQTQHIWCLRIDDRFQHYACLTCSYDQPVHVGGGRIHYIGSTLQHQVEAAAVKRLEKRRVRRTLFYQSIDTVS